MRNTLIPRAVLSLIPSLFMLLITSPTGAATPIVPGTGMKLETVGDDFEDPNWKFYPNFPKSSEEQDENRRSPGGKSGNGRWYEGMKRGCPDVVQVVPTPAGGPAGSKQAMLMRTVQSGVPGKLSYQMQQDDFICNVWQRVGYKIPVNYGPSVVARVFMPPIDTWENRTGPTFGFRISMETHVFKVPEDAGFFKRKQNVVEPYWPGMFVELRSETDRNNEYDTAFWRIRGNSRGGELQGPVITVTGWWTVGMSVTGEGMVHYYIKQGIEDLTAADHVTSQLPYGFRGEVFKTFFFNVCNRDDGRTKSTDWVVDNCEVFLANPPQNLAKRRTTAR